MFADPPPLSGKQDPVQTRELDILRRESARNGKITETYMTGLRVMKMIAAKLSFVTHNNKPDGMDWKDLTSCAALPYTTQLAVSKF